MNTRKLAISHGGGGGRRTGPEPCQLLPFSSQPHGPTTKVHFVKGHLPGRCLVLFQSSWQAGTTPPPLRCLQCPDSPRPGTGCPAHVSSVTILVINMQSLLSYSLSRIMPVFPQNVLVFHSVECNGIFFLCLWKLSVTWQCPPTVSAFVLLLPSPEPSGHLHDLPWLLYTFALIPVNQTESVLVFLFGVMSSNVCKFRFCLWEARISEGIEWWTV